MKLEKLDYEEFFLDKYSKIDRGFGIGAISVITPSQMINVINITNNNKKELNGWAQGDHLTTFYEVLKQIYCLSDNRKFSNLLERLIHIRYVNWTSKFGKYVEVNIPCFINNNQYQNLLVINDILDELSLKYKLKVDVRIEGKVFVPFEKEEFGCVIFDDNVKNNLVLALDYLMEHDRVNDKEISKIFPLCYLDEEKSFIFEESLKKR